ncbi:hypothetical protein DFH09DRAFT_1360400 [Mycena vulgaris]|nr:hypothetical protein DFH09DRAFT_1360400 [Mycena vulgaris]
MAGHLGRVFDAPSVFFSSPRPSPREISIICAIFTMEPRNFEFVAVEPPSQRTQPLPPAQPYKKMRWAEYTPETASRTTKPAMNPRNVASDIPLDKLKISAEQRASLEEMYRLDATATPDRLPVDHLFKLDAGDQLHAAAIMAPHGLDLEAREHLSNRWAQQWSRIGIFGKRPITHQPYCPLTGTFSDCGYDHGCYQSKQRNTPVPFTGCLSHAEITYVIGSQKILRIRGYFQHNQACKDALFTRIPPIPVHSSKNREFFAAGSYSGFPADLRESPYRWSIETRDSRSLYSQFNRLNGVKVKEKPQINMDEWLDPASPQYNATLAEAIFHYSARSSKAERFEVCIATDEMRQAAWKYGHESQIILDGTFGVCDSRLLLFIIMVVDGNKKGIPVAFLLFSAPPGNKQSSAGYDTAILAKLIHAWTTSLTKCGHLYGFAGIVFNPFTAITDTDLKERGALLIVIPMIWLLICRFHLRQSWKNNRNKLLKGKSQLKIDLKHRLKRLEDSLVETQDITEARTLLATEIDTLLLLGTSKSILRAIRHVKYLTEYWTTDNLWKSWSNYGRKVAAALLGCPMDGVIPTTNHLESFKRKHLRRWQNGSRRLRVDVLIQILVIHVLPSIFQDRRFYREQSLRLAAQIRQLPGGQALLQDRLSRHQKPAIPSVAYLPRDRERDGRAATIVIQHQISTPTLLLDNSGVTFTCYSSEALDVESDPVQYTITVLFNGVATCKCTDFRKHGGACKHLRAALIMLDWLRKAYALEIQSSITSPPAASVPAELPTARAAAVVADILNGDDSCHDDPREDDVEEDDGDDSDNESVATDESSDSGEDDDDEIDTQAPETSRVPEVPSASNHQQALGEQALARTLFELDDMGSKFGDLAEFLKNTQGPLPSSARNMLTTRCEPLAAFMAQVDRLCSEDHPPSIPSVAAITPLAVSM